ncbi:hypothetical protein Tco_0622514, partial [Tanacetum coccineum]
MDNLETQLNKEKLHETDSKNAVRMLKTPFQKFFHSKLLKTSNYDYNVREAIEDFKDYTQEAQFFKDLIIQNMESIEKYINEKALHERQIKKRLNERKFLKEQHQTYSSQRHRQVSRRLLEDIFISWDGYQLKVRFLVFLDGLEPYLLKTLEDGPFVPMSSLYTSENPLPKCQNQWSNAESCLANEDKRLKSIIITCLPNDVMKSVIKCKRTKEMWNDLILAHEGPSDIRDTKIAALRLKSNAFKSLEGEKVHETFTRLKCLLNDLENNGVTIPQAEFNATLATLYGKYNYEERLIDQIYESEIQIFTIQFSSSKALIFNTHFQDSDSDIKEDQRTSNEFMADLNAEYHERAILANQKRFYKRERVKRERRKNKRVKKGLIDELFDWDDESVSSNDEGSTKIRAFMVIAEDEPSVGKIDARSDQWVDITIKKVIEKWTYSKVTLYQLLSKQVPKNIVKALGRKGRRKEKISSKEEPLPKLIGAAPFGISESLISLSDLTLNMADLTLDPPIPKKTRPSIIVSPAYVIKKKTEKSLAV